MATTLNLNLSRGPALRKGIDQGVHIIFVAPSEPGPAPNPLPPDEELATVAKALEEAEKKAQSPIQQTDVIVYKGRPWHKVGQKLLKHPEVHQDHDGTVLKLKVLVEKGVWWSEQRFKIESIVLEPEHKPHGSDHKPVTDQPPEGAAQKPAGPQTPFNSLPETKSDIDIDKRQEVFFARSDEPIEKAKGHEYKITFSRTQDGLLIDPNMRCT